MRSGDSAEQPRQWGLQSRVGKGISAQASHRTVRDSLPSYGSSNTLYII